MKKLTIAVMVVLAAILIASPVLAAGSSHSMEVAKQGPGKKQKPTVISMTGTIIALDPAEKTIEIQVRMTNKAFIKYRGRPLLVYTTSTTKYIWWVGKVRDLTKGYDDLQIGDKVSINAKLRPNGNFYARRVQAFQPRIPQ